MSADTTARAIDLYTKASRRADEAADRQLEFTLMLIAGERFTLMGRPAEVTINWPEGMPGGYTDEVAFRAYMTKWLEEHRARMTRRAA